MYIQHTAAKRLAAEALQWKLTFCSCFSEHH